MNDYTHLYARYAQTTRRFVPEFLDQWRRLPLWFVIFPSTVAAVILFFMHTFRQKSSRLYFICVLYGVGLGLFLLMAITGVHTIYERHFVWLSSLCAVAVAATLMRLWAAARRPAKKGLVAFAAVLMAAMLWESYAITEETFKITPMRQWIDTQSVTGSQVVTMWWQLNSAGLQAATIVPGGFISKGRVSDKEFWYLDDPRFFIQWSVLHQAFQMGLCRIFITSGTGTRSLVGCKDSVLASVRPAAEWSHPFNYVRRPYFDPDVEPIKAYRLEDIFKPMSRAPDKKL